MKSTLLILTLFLIATSVLFFFEYRKRSIWFSNTKSDNDPFSQREDFVSSELNAFGFGRPFLKNNIVYRPIFSFQNNEGSETEFALTKLIFEDSAIINSKELNKELGNQGYTLVASPNEYYECSVGDTNTYAYHKICFGCDLSKRQKTKKVSIV